MKDIKPIEWVRGRVRILDQTRLPQEEVYLELESVQDVASAIREMRIRGAPALGIAAAYGIALGAQGITAVSKKEFLEQLRSISRIIASTRPTAVNLFRAIERMEKVAEAGKEVSSLKKALLEEAHQMAEEGERAERLLARYGAELIKDGDTLLTHCNTGALATGGYGTALGVIRYAWEEGKRISVFATETRPLLQGARLTAWELKRLGIPFTLITDSMAGHFLRSGKIQAVFVGADRIAANGDTANKIGTYSLAVLAKENGVPFYVAAPTSTLDLSIPSGDEIPIEERSPGEVTQIMGKPIAPEGTVAANPAFDITPHSYISAIITEKGIIREPYEAGLRKVVELK